MLMSNLGWNVPVLTQTGAKSAFFGPGWGLEVKKWCFSSTRWVFWGQISVFKQIRARIMGFSTLMGNLGLKCHCLTQTGAKSAFFGPYWGLEVKNGDFGQRVEWFGVKSQLFWPKLRQEGQIFCVQKLVAGLGWNVPFLTQTGAKSAFFGPGWGLEVKKWRFSSMRWVIWGQISIFLAQIEARR